MQMILTSHKRNLYIGYVHEPDHSLESGTKVCMCLPLCIHNVLFKGICQFPQCILPLFRGEWPACKLTRGHNHWRPFSHSQTNQ